MFVLYEKDLKKQMPKGSSLFEECLRVKVWKIRNGRSYFNISVKCHLMKSIRNYNSGVLRPAFCILEMLCTQNHSE